MSMVNYDRVYIKSYVSTILTIIDEIIKRFRWCYEEILKAKS